MHLDNHGKIAAADIAFYAPLLVITGFLILRHGYTRALGWLFLFLLSNVRLVFGILVLVMEGQKKPSIGIFIAISILASVGVTLLLMASMGFLRTVSNIGFSDKPYLLRSLDRTHFLFTIAIALIVAGGSMRIPTNKPSTQSTGKTLSRVGIVIATSAFMILVGFTTYFWVHRRKLTASRKMLLTAFTFAIPFLVVRIVYSILGAFASTLYSKWSPTKGSWVAFLLMGLLTEFIVVLIYVIAGISIPYSKDEEAAGLD